MSKHYDQKCQSESYFRGLEPAAMSYNLLPLSSMERAAKLLNIGCGRAEESLDYFVGGSRYQFAVNNIIAVNSVV